MNRLFYLSPKQLENTMLSAIVPPTSLCPMASIFFSLSQRPVIFKIEQTGQKAEIDYTPVEQA